MGKRSFRLPALLIRKLLAAMALLPIVGFSLRATTVTLPSGGETIHGNVSISIAGGLMDITQTGQVGIVNWSDFSIGAGASVNIHQSVNAALLNRVTGANPSQLLGQLNATGRVILVNPNGVVVGAGASINAQEFMASALAVDNSDFIDFATGDAARLRFEGTSTASVVNLGSITANDGDAILIAYRVANEGQLMAANGVAGLAAGTKVWLAPQNAQHLIVESDLFADAADGTGVSNSGTMTAIQAELKAAGGNLYALAINQTGIVQATGVAVRDGRVLLTSDQGTVAHAAGTIRARNADGTGGEVLVGGDYRGLDPNIDDNGVHLAAVTTVGAGAIIDVSANIAGADGGRAVVWANRDATFAGSITAEAGSGGGTGGTAIVAGGEQLDFTGSLQVGSAGGDDGTILLALPSANINVTGANATANSVLSNTALSAMLGSANVVLEALGNQETMDVGNIRVNGALAWTSGNQLTLKSGNNVRVNADITAAAGAIEFQVMGVDTFSDRNSVFTGFDATITADRLTIGQNADSAFIGFNPPPAQFRSTGLLNFQGPLKVGTLDIKIENAGIELFGPSGGAIDDAISLLNEANEIGAITSSVGGGSIGGNILIATGTGDLSVSADFSNILAGAATSIAASGSLTLEGAARFAASDGGEVVLAAKGGTFTNSATAEATAVTLDASSRFLIYSDNPTDTTTGGLAGKRFYGATYAAYTPSNVSDFEGNFIFYRFQPVLTFSSSASRLYGQDNPALVFTVNGLLDGDELAKAFTGSPALSTAATSAENVGQYTINVAAGTAVSGEYNYALSFEPGTLTITPAPLTIAADNKARTQGGANPPLTASFTGLVNDDLPADIDGLVLATTADIDSTPGTYDITASGATNANYDIAFINGTLTVNGIPTLLITADSFGIRYGAPLPSFTASITGFGAEDDESLVNGLTFTSTAVANSPVGTYHIVPANATAPGYEISYFNGTLTIDPALLTITAGTVNRFYGAQNPAFGVSYAGFVFGQDESLVSGLTFTTFATAESNVGNYAVTPAGATAPNYAITFVPGTLTVNPAPLSIEVDDLAKVFGDLNPTFTATATGLVLGQTLAGFDTLTFATTATQFTGAGEVAITASLTGENNYATTITPGTLSITPRPVTVRIGGGTREYGDANPTLTIGLFGDNPVGTSNFFANNVVLGISGTAATPSSDVGAYATTVTEMSAANPNFAVTVEEGTLTVTPAPLTVRANNTSRPYGSANPVFTASTTGLKLSDTLTDVLSGLAFTTAATPASNVGAYAITPGGTPTSANYALTFTPGTFTVNRAPLFVVPALSSRLYGDPDPAFTITATGLLNGDTVSVVTQRSFSGSAPSAGVGSRPITILGATSTNYALTFGPGTINILPRPLTITANDFTREYGEPNPAFTFSFSNLASFDTPTVIPGVVVNNPPAVSASVLAGGYALSPFSGANPNYTISYVPGRLDITPAPLLVQIGNASREYGDANPAPSINIATGLKGDDTLATLGLQVSTAAVVTSDAGNYLYEATATNPNYLFNFSIGVLEITPAPLFVNLDNVFRRYGDETPASYTGILGGLKFAASFDSIVFVNDPTFVDTDVGIYNLGALSLTDNYTIAGVSGQVFISPRPLTLNFADLSRVFGDENPSESILLSALDFENVFAPGDQPLDVIRISAAATPTSDVGAYPIQVAVLDPNYLGSPTVTGSLTVTPRPLSVAFGVLNRVYGQNNPATYHSLRATGFPNDLPGFTLLDTVLEISGPAPTANIGSYPLSATLLSSNYTLQSFSGLMDVARRPISVLLPESVRRVYGEANPAIPAPVVLTPVANINAGVAPFHTIADVLSYDLPGITAPVGFYSLGASLNNNYDVTVFEADSRIFVDPRPISVTIGPSFSRVFGASNPAGLASVVPTSAPASGLASFDNIADVIVVAGPGPQQNTGIYNLAISEGVSASNYDVTITAGAGSTATITSRPVTVTLPGFTRLYGDANPAVAPLTIAEALPDFHTVADVIGLNSAPDVRSNSGVYPVVKTLNPNYTFTFTGLLDYTIEQRVLDLGRIYKTYGDSAFVFSASGGDGPASFDTLADLLRPALIGAADINAPALGAGYYALAGFGLSDATNYRISADTSSVFTVLPRLVSINIADVNLVFDTAEEVREYFANENLVLAATASGLVNGDDFDDAFPIIRYQLVDTDATPVLPVVPTIDNVVLPSLQSLIDNPATSGNGVVLASGPAGGASSGLPRSGTGTLTNAGLVLEKFATVFDGFDTEANYVLGGVFNGSVRLEFKPAVVSNADQVVASGTFGITNFTLSVNPELEAIRRAEAARGSLTVTSAANPPGLLEFFTAGNNELGVEMILSYFQGAMSSGSLYAFESGGLLAEITRSDTGTLEDVTPFRIQRWLERNADNPAAMGLLAEPLATYAKDFLNKDPATHTESEAAFSRVLSLHMTKARNEFAERVEESRDAWVAKELERGANMADLFGRDMPYKDFFTDGGAQYVSQNIEARIALVAGSATTGAVATGSVMVGLTGAILPFAVTTTTAGVTSLGGSIATGASVAAAGASAAVAVPAVVVAGAIVGSIARGIQVGENIEQANIYNGLVNSAGRTVDPSNFELTKASGKDDPINQTIFLGALAGMLYP